ncbi:class I SAM-dependent methyltransferase [Yinghuangia seranimata]|uniref:class I SAM-dependent methyltransferase n=1 Tax=Yinghuangia seranimata TaxID=408067 RepID=UPI00248CF820|nr:class I SAM-dependent methyltransferase [Yinghuangia seranimata]MDI2126698.1 class I SAM-dependent methyltransferase [Yinghuangia seranimata]
MGAHEVARTGYTRAVDVYERARPSYPLPALAELSDALGLEAGRTVVDLGAGTGLFTRLLALTGARVVAVEPVAAMRGRLAELLPSVEVADGTAERTGLPEGSADAVVAAQAWHWFDGDAALGEVEHVLAPGGGLGLVWNTYDDDVPWVRDYQDIYMRRAPAGLPSHREGTWRATLTARPGWGGLQERHFANPHRMSREGVIDRMLSSSHIACLDAAEQARVRREVEDVLDGHPETRGRDHVELPYVTDVYWTVRTGAGGGTQAPPPGAHGGSGAGPQTERAGSTFRVRIRTPG